MAQSAGSGRWGKLLVGLVLLFLAPLIGAGWGLWTLITRYTRRGTPAAPSGQRTVLAAAVLVVSTAAAINIYPAAFADRQPAAVAATPPPVVFTRPTVPARTPSAAPAPTVAFMPDLLGAKLPDAEKVLRGIDRHAERTDASPRGRNVFAPKNWTVIDTSPQPGKPLNGDATLFVLRNEEAAWFAANPTMPKLKAGQETDKLALEPIGELLLHRYAKGKAPADATTATPGHGDEYGSGDEPAAEKKARAGLKTASIYGTRVVGSIPAAGRPLRPGQFIVVTVKDGPKSDSSSSGGGSSRPNVPNVGDDDDDVNIPGWLCPTRFC